MARRAYRPPTPEEKAARDAEIARENAIPKVPRQMACGHLEQQKETIDTEWLRLEVPCQECNGAAKLVDPRQFLREMTHEELEAYGRKARELAAAGNRWWAGKLQYAREEWKRRKHAGSSVLPN